MKTLSIVILNYNSGHVLKPCLESLAAYGDWMKSDCEVFVVDNASSDGSIDMVRKEFSWVKTIVNSENLGFAKGNNVALKQVSGQFVLLLNPDTVVPLGTLNQCLNYIKSHTDIGVLTCRVELSSGAMDMDCHRGFPTPWASVCYFSGLEKLFPRSKIFGQYHQTWKNLDTIHEIDSAVGAFMLMPKTAIEKVGLLDEDFFFYGEDIDWCFRFKQAGYKIIYYPDCKIVHYKGVSSGMRKESQTLTTATKASRLRVKKASVDAMRLFYDKHYKQHYPFFITWLVYCALWGMMKKRTSGI